MAGGRSSKFGANYWKLWTASVTSNLGDGIATVAYPWLASAITRDGFQLGLVVLAGRLPWLLFSLPAGVITDRVDRRRVIIAMDVTRAILTVSVAVLVLTTPVETGQTMMLVALIAASLLLGTAEVLRDNSAQTILPAIVAKDQLERANGRMWGAEMVMNSFVGPPAGGFLVGAALALPFFVDSSTFAVAAVLILLIRGDFRPPVEIGPRPRFRVQLAEGFGWLWSHPLFRPMALVLGVINALSTMALATYVLFVQEILGLEATAFGVLLTAGAAGGVLGSLAASRVAGWIGKGPSLFAVLVGGAATFAVTGLTSSAIVVWLMFVVESFLAVMWNVITVSLRQRVIPDKLLGRVNSVYRFFGWGMMSLGALAGGAVVSIAQPLAGREWALRLPFLVAAVVQIGMFLYALPRLNSKRIAETEATVDDAA